MEIGLGRRAERPGDFSVVVCNPGGVQGNDEFARRCPFSPGGSSVELAAAGGVLMATNEGGLESFLQVRSVHGY